MYDNSSCQPEYGVGEQLAEGDFRAGRTEEERVISTLAERLGVAPTFNYEHAAKLVSATPPRSRHIRSLVGWKRYMVNCPAHS